VSERVCVRVCVCVIHAYTCPLAPPPLPRHCHTRCFGSASASGASPRGGSATTPVTPPLAFDFHKQAGSLLDGLELALEGSLESVAPDLEIVHAVGAVGAGWRARDLAPAPHTHTRPPPPLSGRGVDRETGPQGHLRVQQAVPQLPSVVVVPDQVRVVFRNWHVCSVRWWLARPSPLPPRLCAHCHSAWT
jgi:hypothetical protein